MLDIVKPIGTVTLTQEEIKEIRKIIIDAKKYTEVTGIIISAYYDKTRKIDLSIALSEGIYYRDYLDEIGIDYVKYPHRPCDESINISSRVRVLFENATDYNTLFMEYDDRRCTMDLNSGYVIFDRRGYLTDTQIKCIESLREGKTKFEKVYSNALIITNFDAFSDLIDIGTEKNIILDDIGPSLTLRR